MAWKIQGQFLKKKKKKNDPVVCPLPISATLDLWSSGFCWSHWSISVSVPRGGRTVCLSCCLRINVQLWQTANADFLVAAVVYLNSVPALSSIFNRLGKTGLKHSLASKSRPPLNHQAQELWRNLLLNMWHLCRHTWNTGSGDFWETLPMYSLWFLDEEMSRCLRVC